MTDANPFQNDAPKRCPTCGGPLPAGTPGASCPKCMLVAGFATGGGGSGSSAAAASAKALTPEEIAARFPDYEIEGVLGRGGMGVVFKARHKGLDRTVALKVLPPASAATAGFAERFQREARALARLTHPNIVGVHEYGEREGVFFLVMEYVDGVNVRLAMREGRIGQRDALGIVPQICDALQYAHEHGVVHRDIKPENVLVDLRGCVKVADFGLAKIVAGDSDAPDLTLTGEVMGTPHYMAPEQFEKPTTVDHRADIYSLGVVFYEMLTGELPLGRFDPPSRRAQIDVRLDEVVLRSLEKAPERRWQHASDVNREVGTIASGAARPLPAEPQPVPGATQTAGSATQVAASFDRDPVRPRELAVCAALILAGVLPLALSDARHAFGAASGYALLTLTGIALLVLVWMRSWHTFAPRPDGTRRSRLAAFALACHGVSFVCGAVAIAATSSHALLLGAVLTSSCTWLLFVGLIAGITAWIRIGSSGGRLTGLWQAIAATFIPLAAPCLLFPLAYLLHPAETNAHVEDVTGTRITPVEKK